MRLSTAADRDDAAAVALLHAAFDAGVDFLDSADAYCLDASEAGHNERLIARALASWNGDRSRIVAATKGGLARPEGRWVADGRARHLVAACEASRRALGVERIALYQLHAPDPRTPLATSVRALAALKRDGLVERIGLCNVDLKQLEAALRLAEIDAVQVELSVLHDDSLWNGVAQRCLGGTDPAASPIGRSAATTSARSWRATRCSSSSRRATARRPSRSHSPGFGASLRSCCRFRGRRGWSRFGRRCGRPRSLSTTPIASGSTSASLRRANSAASAQRDRPYLGPRARWCL